MYIVVGLGITGLSVVRYLKKINEPVLIMDSRPTPPGLTEIKQEFPEIECVLGRFDEELLCRAHEIILSPGLPLTQAELQKARNQGVPIIGDIELFARAANAPIVGITGTNGKSTVTTMIGDIARNNGINVAVGGNIGEAALNLLNDNVELYVLELSSFQLETTQSLALDVAILLNITPDHNDRYANAEEYIQAKQHVFHHAKLAIYNRSDALTTPQSAVIQKQSFGLDEPFANNLGVKIINGEKCLVCGDKKLMPLNALASPRPNFINNALAALSVVQYFDWSLANAQQTLHSFKGLPHRCQFILEKAGVRWYNDSKATNVGATIAGLQDVAADITGQQIVLLGGVGKGQDFSELQAPLLQHAKHVILFGQDKQEIEQILAKDTPRTQVNSLSEAVELAAQIARQGDAVILAPACASFDMFKDYRDRGEQFMELVNAKI